MPACRAPSAAAMTPPTGLTLPSSASSPTAAQPRERIGVDLAVAARIARAMGKSKPEPSLRRPAGARLTVIRRATGHSSSAESMPLRSTLLGLLAGAVGEPDDRQPGQAALDVGLDLDPPRLEPDERVRDRARQHLPTLERKA